MKKLFFIVLAILLCSFAAVSAQETLTETDTLSFYTVGKMFYWSDTGQDVYNKLLPYAEVGLDIAIEQDDLYGKTIVARGSNDDESYIYVFYFDDDTEILYEVECVTTLYSIDVRDVYYGLIEEYGLEDAIEYEDELWDEYVADFDAGGVVAGDGTIVVLAASAETDEYYAQAAIVFVDRAYWEGY